MGVPIKTTISANVLEEALNGTVTVRPLPIGTSVSGKVILALYHSATVLILVYHFYLFCDFLQVEKQCAHFFGVTINEQQAEAGIVVRVTSTAQSKFKVHTFA